MQNNKKQTWRLADAEQRHKDTKGEFEIPTRAARKAVKVGDIVEIVFQRTEDHFEGPGGERIWVEIVRIADNEYVGALRNNPAFIQNLEFDDEVTFEHWHIIDIVRPR